MLSTQERLIAQQANQQELYQAFLSINELRLDVDNRAMGLSRRCNIQGYTQREKGFLRYQFHPITTLEECSSLEASELAGIILTGSNHVDELFYIRFFIGEESNEDTIILEPHVAVDKDHQGLGLGHACMDIIEAAGEQLIRHIPLFHGKNVIMQIEEDVFAVPTELRPDLQRDGWTSTLVRQRATYAEVHGREFPTFQRVLQTRPGAL